MKLQFWKKVQQNKQRRITNIRPSYTSHTSYNSMLPDSPNVTAKDVYWKIYKNEAPVRGAIDVIVNAICSTGYTIRTYKQGDVDMDDPRVAEITDWLSYPDQPIPFIKVLQDMALNVMIFSNSFVEVVANQDENRGWMYPLDTRDCEPQYNEGGTTITGLLHQVMSGTSSTGMRETYLSNDQHVHVTMSSSGGVMGLSTIESIVKDVDMYAQTIDYANRLFSENGVPAMHVNMEEPNSSDWEMMQRSIEDLIQGKTFLTAGKVTVDPIGGKVNEISYDKIKDIVYQAIMTAFQVPPSLMCYPGESTSESSREQTNSFAMNVQAKQRIINNAIDRIIIKIWGSDYADIRFELNPWVNEKAQAAIDEIGIQNGYLTPNMILRRKGEPTVSWGDQPYSMNFIGELLGYKPWEQSTNNQQASGGRKAQGQREGQSAETPRPSRQGKGEEKSLIEEMHDTNLMLADIVKRELAVKEEIQKRVAEYFAR